jgi:hypothetical protein
MSQSKVVMVEAKKDEPGVYQVKHCAFPECYAEAKEPVGPMFFCRKHAEMAKFFLWIAGKIRVKEPDEDIITKSGIILPK